MTKGYLLSVVLVPVLALKFFYTSSFTSSNRSLSLSGTGLTYLSTSCN